MTLLQELSAVLGIFAVINFGLILWLVIHSRHWKTPYMAGQISQHRTELDMLKNNISAMRGENAAARHDWVVSNEAIWKELRAINTRLDCPIQRTDCPLSKHAEER